MSESEPLLNWSGGMQGYLCAHSNNQQYTPPNVSAWATGNGPVCQQVTFSLTITSADALSIYVVNDGLLGDEITLPFQMTAGMAYGPIGAINEATNTNFEIDLVSAPSGDLASVFFPQPISVPFFLSDDGDNVPLDFTIATESQSQPFMGEYFIYPTVGTNDDLQVQLAFGLYLELPGLAWDPGHNEGFVLSNNDLTASH